MITKEDKIAILQIALKNLTVTYTRNGCCLAIRRATETYAKRKFARHSWYAEALDMDWDMRRWFAHWFKPKGRTRNDFWWGSPWGEGTDEVLRKRRHQRVVALAFALTLAEEGL